MSRCSVLKAALGHRKLSRAQVWMLYLVGFVVMLILVGLFLPGDGYRLDFDVYRTGAQVFLTGGDLYGELPPMAGGIRLPFTYPPVAAALFSVFVPVPFEVGSVFFTAASIICLLVCVHLSLTTLARGDSAVLTVATMVASYCLLPVRETFAYGQINLILMALVMLGCLAPRKGSWWGGILVALACAIKLTPLVFIGYFVLRRDWRNTVSTVAGALGLTAVGFLLAPQESALYWTKVLVDPARVGRLGYVSNQSINAIVHRAGLHDGDAKLVWFVVATLAGLGLMTLAYFLSRHGRPLSSLVAVSLVALLCSPVSWSHHWVWVLPALVVLVLEGRADLLRFGGAAAGLIIFCMGAFWWLPHSEDRELNWTWWQHLVGNLYVLWAIAWAVLMVLSLRGAGARTDETTQDAAVPSPS